MTDLQDEALGRAMYRLVTHCPLKHDPKYKTYIPPNECPVLLRLIKLAPLIRAGAKIEEEQLLADRLLETAS